MTATAAKAERRRQIVSMTAANFTARQIDNILENYAEDYTKTERRTLSRAYSILGTTGDFIRAQLEEKT